MQFKVSVELIFDRKRDVMQKLVNEMSGVKQALRAQRFAVLQEQINNSIRERISQYNASGVYLALESEATKSGLKLHVSAATSETHQRLVVAFKAEETEVHIKSPSWDYTIRVRNLGPTSTGLERRQSRGSWCVLENEAAVERMLDAAFQATFEAL